MLLLVALTGCHREAPPPPPFTCATAAASLGHPDANVSACDALPHVPEVVQVALEAPDLPGGRLTTTVIVHEGKVTTGSGGAALSTFLAALPPDRQKALTMQDINGLLRAFAAYPEGFGPRDWNFAMPGIGTSSFQPEPLRLVLYTGKPPAPDAADPSPLVSRATLTGPPYVWTLERRQPDGTWTPGGQRGLEDVGVAPPAP